jgi:GT2 family glycosyltransferase/glycosyltransferase involved in cell wall biosynthesis
VADDDSTATSVRLTSQWCVAVHRCRPPGAETLSSGAGAARPPPYRSSVSMTHLCPCHARRTSEVCVRLVCITGMHRSGTSAIARMVNLLGISLGEDADLLPPAPDNPKGFWEHRGVKEVNDAVLRHLGGTWHDLPAFEEGWEEDAALDALRDSARSALQRISPVESSLVGAKDPRFSLLLPFWRGIVTVEKPIVALRHPSEVAASLAVRNNTDRRDAALLWLAYTSRALTTADEFTLVLYEDVLRDPVAVAARLADRLGLPTPGVAVRQQLVDFVEPQLNHHQRSVDAVDHPTLRLAASVYDALRENGQMGVDGLLPFLADASPLTFAQRRETSRAKDLSEHLAQANTTLQRMRLRSEEQSSRLDEQRDELVANQRRLGEQRDELSQTRRQADVLREELDRSQVERAADGRKLQEADHKLQSALGDLARLKRRRSVRLALKAADNARPLFRAVRGARRRLHGRPPSASLPWPKGGRGPIAPPAWRYERREVSEESIAALAAALPTIVVPIHNAPRELSDCIESVLRNTTMPATLLLIDDASTDPEIDVVLKRYEGLDGVRLLRNPVNLGFTATVNRGMRESAGDVVLLNSDTRVTPRWLQRLTMAAWADDRTASATPFSDNAGAFSAPVIGQQNPLPTHLTDDAAGRLVTTSSRCLRPQAPTGNGFCMYIRRSALDDVGVFDEDAFPRGYGEENEWSMRALGHGWKHVVADDVLVYHSRGASFGDEKIALGRAGRAVIDERHPDYSGLVREFVGSIELARAREAVGRAYADDASRVTLPRVLYVIHHGGGGTTSTNLDLLRALPAGRERYVLSSDIHRLRLLRVHPGGEELIDELALDPPLNFWGDSDERYRKFAAAALVGCGIELVHVRHLIKHTLDVPRLASELHIPTIFSFHDFYLACPTVHLLDDQDKFCGGTCTLGDGNCRIPMPWIRDSAPHLKHSGVYAWRDKLRPLLLQAAALVTTSETTREIYLRAYPELDASRFHVIEHGRDLPQAQAARAPEPGRPVRILLPGNIDVHKGKQVVEALARIDRGRRLQFHFLGNSPSDLQDIGVLHGPYQREEFTQRVADIAPAFIGLFSICAETYSHALSEAWAAGVPCLVSPLGALGERVRTHGGGWIVDIDHVDDMYREILRIADDPTLYEAQRRKASVGALRSVGEMAADYEHLYRSVAVRSRKLAPLEHPTEVGLFVTGGPSAQYPGTVHVRTLRRLKHPDLVQDYQLRIADPTEFLAGALRVDLALVQRTALRPDAVDDFVEHCQGQGIPLVFEIDDNLLDVGGLPGDQQHWQSQVPALRRLATAADLVTVSTPALAEVVQPLNRNVVVVPNLLDEELWFGPCDLVSGPQDDEIRILYMGTRTHGGDLTLLRPVLEDLRAAVGRRVTLEVIGGEEPGRGQDWYRRLDVPAGRATYPEFVPWLRSQRLRWHLAVAPLADTPFNAYKSDLKYLEYAALGIAGIYSNVGPYSLTVKDGETGLLADNAISDWRRCLAALVSDEQLRGEVVTQALAEVAETRTLRRGSLDYSRLLRETQERRSKSSSVVESATA